LLIGCKGSSSLICAMSNKLILTLLSAIPLALASCADHAGTQLAVDGPSSPINTPDTELLPNPGESTPPETGSSTTTVDPGTGTGSGGTGNAGNGGNESSGSGSGTGGGGNTGGGQTGSPVPEPGTLLLFGTGLAGLAGTALRRRRRRTAD
jgi:hypothetical protein